MTTSRSLSIVLGALAFAILLHAAVPRYTWQIEGGGAIRVDRWTGASVVGLYNASGRWVPRDEYWAERHAKTETAVGGKGVTAAPARQSGKFSLEDIDAPPAPATK